MRNQSESKKINNINKLINLRPYCISCSLGIKEKHNKSRGRNLERNWDKRVFLLAIHCHLYYPSKSGLRLVCNVYRNLMSCPETSTKFYVLLFGFWRRIRISLETGEHINDQQLSKLCPETSTKLYVHKFGFWKTK